MNGEVKSVQGNREVKTKKKRVIGGWIYGTFTRTQSKNI